MDQKILTFLCSLLILVSCEYDPKGEFRVNLDSGGIDTCEISLDPLINDTLILLEETVYTFKLDLDSLARVFSVRVMVDSSNAGYESSPEGEFTLNPSRYNSGYHNLHVRIETSSGTNSMADNYNHERRVYNWYWTIFIDKERPEEINITNIYIYEGSLKIEWEQYTRVNFQKYRIKSYVWSEKRQSYARAEFEEIIYDQEQNYLIDRHYTGGKVKYYLEVFTQNPEYSVSTSFEYESGYPYYYESEIFYDSTIIRWAKCPFYSNFSKYVLLNNDGVGPIEILNIDDTVFVDTSIKFGTKTNYTLFVSSSPFVDRSEDFYSITKSFDRDSEFYGFNEIKRINDSLICRGYGNNLSFYNLNSRTIEKEILLTGYSWRDPAPFDVAPESRNFAYTNGESAFIIDPVTFEQNLTVNIPTEYKDNFNINNVCISEQGYLCMFLKRVHYYDGIIYTVNLKTLEPSGTLILDRYVDFQQYVSDGNYLFFRKMDSVYIYQHIGNEMQLHTRLENEGIYYFNNPKDEMYIIRASNADVRSIQGKRLIKQINHRIRDSFIDNINIDPTTGYLGYCTEEKYMIFDFESEQYVNQIPLASQYIEQGPMAILNSILFSSYYGGRYLKLEF